MKKGGSACAAGILPHTTAARPQIATNHARRSLIACISEKQGILEPQGNVNTRLKGSALTIVTQQNSFPINRLLWVGPMGRVKSRLRGVVAGIEKPTDPGTGSAHCRAFSPRACDRIVTGLSRPTSGTKPSPVNFPSLGRKRVVVIGGGITGLAAAHRLVQLDPTLDVTLLEAGTRLGGVLETVRRDGFLIERSADNFITNVPWAVDLCHQVGLADQLLPTTSRQRNAMVVHRGRLERVPPGFMLMAPSRIWPLVTTPILSPWGKLRLLGEYFVPRRRGEADESLASFARRRFGRETFERIVQPLVGGIYAADPEKLSLRATLPRFVEMERRSGSMIRAARRQRADGSEHNASASDSGARYGLFVAPREGLTSLVQAIAAKLPAGCVRLNSPVEKLTQASQGGWCVQVAPPGGPPMSLDCDAVIVAVAAPVAARLLAAVDRGLADDLGRIEYAGTTIVTLAFRRDELRTRWTDLDLSCPPWRSGGFWPEVLRA